MMGSESPQFEPGYRVNHRGRPPQGDVRRVCLRRLGRLGIAAVVQAGLLLGACQSNRPAVLDRVELEFEPSPWKTQLTDRERAEALAAMQSVAGDYQPVGRLETGPPRGRWSDVPRAARAAAGSQEMVVMQSTHDDSGWTFTLRTIGDQPGRLRVRETGDERVYEAAATIGLFSDETDMASELLDAFEDRMRAFSRKRRLIIDDSQ